MIESDVDVPGPLFLSDISLLGREFEPAVSVN
ncbi:hypothetical protein X727_32875 [Mesorhizobium sp. L103C119B0]|nr:hypothetical protein X727_32875 [Mesorhizobium sp. L103C119B0]